MPVRRRPQEAISAQSDRAPPASAAQLRAQLATLLSNASPSTSDDERESDGDERQAEPVRNEAATSAPAQADYDNEAHVPSAEARRRLRRRARPAESSAAQQLSDSISQQISDQISQQISDQISDEISAQLDAQLDAQFEAAMQEYYAEELNGMDAEMERQIDSQLEDLLSGASLGGAQQQPASACARIGSTTYWERQMDSLSLRDRNQFSAEQHDDDYYDDYEFETGGLSYAHTAGLSDDDEEYSGDDDQDAIDYSVPAAAAALNSLEALGGFFDPAPRPALARVLDVDADAELSGSSGSSSDGEEGPRSSVSAGVSGMSEAELQTLLNSVYGAAGRAGNAPRNVHLFDGSSGGRSRSSGTSTRRRI